MRAFFLNTKNNYSKQTSNKITRANSNSLFIASIFLFKNMFSSSPVIIINIIIGYLDLKSIKLLHLINRV